MSRSKIALLLSLTLALGVASYSTLRPPLLHSAALASPVFGPGASVAWMNGPDLDLAAAEIALFTALPDPVKMIPVTKPTISLLPSSPEKVALASLLSDVSEGEYSLRVRLVDLAGNFSEWSDPVPFRLDRANPSRPSSVKIVL